MLRYFISLSVLFISLCSAQAQNINESANALFKELERVRSVGAPDTQEVILLNEIALHYLYIHPDSALIFARRALKKSESLQYYAGGAKAWNYVGIVHKSKGELELALSSYDSSLALCQKTGNMQDMAQAWTNQGVVWRKQTNYGKALEVYMKALEVFEDVQDTVNLGHTYNNMASVYGKQGNFEEALQWYEKCLNLQRSAGNKVGEARTLYNIAIVFYKQNKWEEAEKYGLKVLDIHYAAGNFRGQAKALNMLGVIAEESGEITEALAYYEDALKVNKELGMRDQIVSVQDNLAALYTSQNQFDKAIAYYKSNLEIAAEIGLPEMLMETNKDLSQLYQQQGELELALDHYKAYHDWKDTVFNVEKQKLEEDAMEKFETLQKEQEIKALQKDGLIDGLLLNSKDDSITIRNTFLVIGALVLAIALILGLYFLSRYVTQKQLRAKEQELNRIRMTEVMDTNEKKVLQAYLEGEDEERKRIAEDLHDRIGSNLLTMKLYMDKLNEDFANTDSAELKDNLSKVGEVVNGTIGEVRHVAHNLASGAISKFGLITALEDLSATIKGAGQVDVMLDVFDVNDEIPRSTEMQLFLVIRELIANTLKHADARLITISISREGDQLTVLFSDDGRGFDWTSQKGKSGIGLQNCFTRIDKLGGQMTVDSRPGHGTTVIFDVPLQDTLTENVD